MRACTPAFKAHLAQEVTTLVTCWKARLKNGTIFGFTDHTRDLTYNGQLYKFASGYTPTAVETSSALNVDNLEVEAILNSPDITEADLMAGLWDYADVEIIWVNYMDLSPTMGHMILKTGKLGEVTIKQSSFLAEIRGLTQQYTNTLGELSSPTCRVKELGDARCKLDLTRLTVTGTIDSASVGTTLVDSARTEGGATGGKAITGISRAMSAVISCPGHGRSIGDIVTISGVFGVKQDGATGADGEFFVGSGTSINGSIVAVRAIPDADHFSVDIDTRLWDADTTIGQTDASLVYSDYISGGLVTPQGGSSLYDYGKISFTSGQNIGLSMEVKSYAQGVIVLQLPMPYPVAAGDAYTLVQGCDRSRIRCRELGNVVNFRGEPDLPGQDKVMRFGGIRN